MISYQVLNHLAPCGAVLVAATTKVLTSCGEDLLVRVDGLAANDGENHIWRLFVVVKSVRACVNEGFVAEEAGGDSVERHDVRFSQFQQSGVALGANEEKDWRT
jgi:hypothetical protein